MLGIEIRAFFKYRQSHFQIAQLLLGLFISRGCQNLGHSITSTTPLGRFLRSVANWRIAHASKSALSAAAMIWRNGQKPLRATGVHQAASHRATATSVEQSSPHTSGIAVSARR